MLANRITIGMTIVALAATTAWADVYYVDADSPNDGAGNDWAHAYHYLQDALGVAAAGDEIRVAEGTHRPDERTANPAGTGVRTATFQLADGVEMYGGYAGYGEPDPDERNVASHETILSGDLLENDGPGQWQDYDENSYHVVTGTGTDQTAVLDGFTVTGGYANGGSSDNYGAGAYNATASPTMRNCRFHANAGNEVGAAIYFTYSSSLLMNCTFSDNAILVDGNGGAVFNNRGALTIKYCTFTGNSTPDYGGGLHNYRASPTVVNCIFDGNTARRGGGMSSVSVNGSTIAPMVINCRFTNNSATSWGGAVINYMYANTRLINCTMSGNTASDGGAVYNYQVSNARIYNTIFWDNSADNIENWISNPVLSYNYSGDPMFVSPVLDDYRLSAGSPCIDAANNTLVPSDSADLDGDGDTTERTPLDLGGYARFLDDPDTGDTGVPDPPDYPEIVDTGAHEYFIDCNNNGIPDDLDILGGTSEDCNSTGIPDECEPDQDGDEVTDDCDNCPASANPGQEDADGDSLGDVCDTCTDTDGDGFGDPGFPANTCPTDNCPTVFNPDQNDSDGDGFGDACDTCTDTDGDGFGDPGFPANTCPTDNCPTIANPGQEDADGDSVGDVCDTCTDTDGDGFGDPGFPANTCPTDNCPTVFNPDQNDSDGDGFGDACDAPGDLDHDGDVDLADFVIFAGCFGGSGVPVAPECESSDLDGDGDVDLADFVIFAGNFTG